MILLLIECGYQEACRDYRTHDAHRNLKSPTSSEKKNAPRLIIRLSSQRNRLMIAEAARNHTKFLAVVNGRSCYGRCCICSRHAVLWMIWRYSTSPGKVLA